MAIIILPALTYYAYWSGIRGIRECTAIHLLLLLATRNCAGFYPESSYFRSVQNYHGFTLLFIFYNFLELLTAHFRHRCGTVVHFVHKIQQIYLGRVARIAARLDRCVELQQSPALSHRLQLWSRLKIQNFPDSDNSPIAVKVRLREYFLCLFNILFLFQANIPRVAPTIELAILIVQVN